MRQKSSPSCYTKACDLLARRGHSTFELSQKLLKKYPIEVVDETISKLLDYHFLDDKKFAEQFVRSRMTYKKRGSFLIKKELAQRGITEKLIQHALHGEDVAAAEKEAAQQFLSKKYEQFKKKYPDRHTLHAKLYFAGGARGFSSQVVQEIVHSLMKSSIS